jgi:hypothetical protein
VKLTFKTFVFALFSLFAVSAHAADSTPFQLALFHPVQLFPKETRVQGLRIDLLYGVNDELSGVDLGLVNRTTGPTQGLQLGAFPFGGVNITDSLDGLQFAGFWAGANFASGDVTGLQIAGILGGMNIAGNLKGVQISGLLLGLNMAQNTRGLQLATLYNQAEDMQGLQLGLVNICTRMRGVQIGLANVIKESKVPFFPIINASF